MSRALNAGMVDRCTTGSPRARPLPARLAASPRSVRWPAEGAGDAVMSRVDVILPPTRFPAAGRPLLRVLPAATRRCHRRAGRRPPPERPKESVPASPAAARRAVHRGDESGPVPCFVPRRAARQSAAAPRRPAHERRLQHVGVVGVQAVFHREAAWPPSRVGDGRHLCYGADSSSRCASAAVRTSQAPDVAGHG